MFNAPSRAEALATLEACSGPAGASPGLNRRRLADILGSVRMAVADGGISGETSASTPGRTKPKESSPTSCRLETEMSVQGMHRGGHEVIIIPCPTHALLHALFTI